MNPNPDRRAGGGSGNPVNPNPDRRAGGGSGNPVNPNPDRRAGGGHSPVNPPPDRRAGGANPSPDHRPGGGLAPNPDRRAGGGNPGFDRERAGQTPPSRVAGHTPHPAPTTRAHNPYVPAPHRVGEHMAVRGHEVIVRRDGRPAVVYARNGMMIRRGPEHSFVRRGVVERNGRIYSFNRAGFGHVRREFAFGGRHLAVRHYYVAGHAFPRFYHDYGWRGLHFDAYVPSAFYAPGYYGWLYRPWARPISFGWGFYGAPWYAYYGGYFAPYPSYPNASFWLTDYLVSQTLEASYREQMESAQAANAAFSSQPPMMVQLSPSVKQMIAEEVQRQIAIEEAAAQQRGEAGMAGIGSLLEDRQAHVLVSNANLDVTTTSGQECMIAQGDVIGLYPGISNPDGEAVPVRILASAGGGCPLNSVVTVSVQDLNEMLNHMRATIDQGLGEIQTSPTMPRPPAGVPMSATQASFVTAAPPFDPNEAAQLQSINNEATSTEREVVTGPDSEDTQGLSRPQPSTLELRTGMDISEAIAVLGKPTNVVKAGSKEILIYQGLGLKLTFLNGKLSAME